MAPIDRQVAAKLQIPADADMDPELEQDKRDQYAVEIFRFDTAVPEMFDRIRINRMMK
jgi:hypothetical protein